MKIKNKYSFKLLLLLIGVAFIAFGFLGDDRNGVKSPKPIYKITSSQESGKQGDAYALNINNIWMPINRKGIIADVNVPPNGSLGQYAGGGFLFSSGFFLSGLSNGALWANAAASASLVEDYVQGVVGGEDDPNAVIYVVNSQDEPFGPSWQDWADAVALGADFYDGDGDGAYNPADDKDGDGEWDENEDMPDLIGDELAWCVFHDGLPVAQRRWNTSIEVGMEVRQSVFAFASAGAIGNIIFVRYRIKYVGTGSNDPEELTDVYFGAWADPDLGDAEDDVIGVDVPRNAGYTYGNEEDAQYGAQVPCFMIDFFQGPRVESPGDTAISVQGQNKGIKYYPGFRNLPISSFVMYINGEPDLRDPDNKEEARFYSLGLDVVGNAPDPCGFPFGEVRGGVDCATVDPRFWFSGDPVTDVGWICTENRDMRQMTNTGPFTLNKDEENEIVIAYVVGRGSNPLDGIVATRSIDDGAQNIFDLNFLAPTPPPAPRASLSASDDFIDIIWETPNQVKYTSQTPTWDLRFEGYQVWAFKTNIPEDFVSGEVNSVLVASYDLDNYIQNIYKENSETMGIELLYEVSPDNQLDYELYDSTDTGRIRLRIFNDPFSPNQAIVKGRPYYFAVTSYALNYDALVYKDDPSQPIGTEGDYYLNSFAFAQEAENIRNILSIVVGEDVYSPPVLPQSGEQFSGGSRGDVNFDPVIKEDLTGDRYRVTFYQDSLTELYSTYWDLENLNTGALYDSLKYYLYGLDDISVVPTEGFITRISNEVAAVDTELTYQLAGPQWVSVENSVLNYVTDDIETATHVLNIGGNLTTYWGTYVNAGQMRRVEIKFGETQKAYRYLNGFYGSSNTVQRRTFTYAESISSADTVGKGPVGQWDVQNDRPFGYIDVPFQVWVEDPNFGERRQLAVAIVEKRADLGGNPDGLWDPGPSVVGSGEYIFIFDEVYDPDGNQRLYKGSTYIGSNVGWADLNGASVNNGVFYPIPDDANITQDERNKVNSPFFNTLYAVGINKISDEATWTNGDIIICGVDNYPYTVADVFEFETKSEGALTAEEERSLWNKVNVYPNPLYGYNTLTNYYSNTPDEPFVTFTNLPEDVTIKIYSLSGTLLRTLDTGDKDSPTSPYLRWDLENESELRVASGMYLAIVSSPIYGDKVLKFAIIMPQKQIQRF
jgi:hypothetical protein